MQLEAQLADAKLAKAHLEAKAEKEAMLREKQEILIVRKKKKVYHIYIYIYCFELT